MFKGVKYRRLRERARSYGNRVRLLHDGEQAIPAMLEAIASAQQELLLEMYWFGSDRTGRRFAEALMERARRGVCVRLIYDAVGSIEADESMFDEMRRAGVEVHEYNPIAPWRARFSFERISHRDHRKLLVVDGQLGITGGLNLADQWAPKSEGGGGFHDDVIEVVGPAATELRWLFYRSFPGLPISLKGAPVPSGDCIVTVLASDLHAERRGIYDGYVNAIGRATSDIIITNSYFIPSHRVRKALARAASRGVRVRVLVPRDSDVKATQLASRALYEWLLTNGVEIYEWRGGILHSKTAVVDDTWSTVGTFNFDALSIHNNLEVNIAVHSREINAALRRRAEEDLRNSSAIDLEQWRERSIAARLLERVFYSLRWGL